MELLRTKRKPHCDPAVGFSVDGYQVTVSRKATLEDILFHHWTTFFTKPLRGVSPILFFGPLLIQPTEL